MDLFPDQVTDHDDLLDHRNDQGVALLPGLRRLVDDAVDGDAPDLDRAAGQGLIDDVIPMMSRDLDGFFF